MLAILLEEEVAEEVEVEEEEDGSNEEKGEAKIEGEVEEEELGMMITLSIQNSTSHDLRLYLLLVGTVLFLLDLYLFHYLFLQ